MKILKLIIGLNILSITAMAQEFRLPLYSGTIPNSINTGQKEKIEKKEITVVSNVQVPDIAVYLPAKKYAMTAGIGSKSKPISGITRRLNSAIASVRIA